MLSAAIKRFRRISTRSALTTIGLAGSVLCAASAQANVDQARVAGLKYLIQAQNGDGRWSSALGELDIQATAQALQTLRRGGLQKSPNYVSGLSWLANSDAQSTDARARKVIALAEGGLGTAAQSLADALYESRAVQDRAVWGGYDGHTISYLDTIFGLSALRVGDRNFESKLPGPIATAVCSVLTNRLQPATGHTAWPMAPAVTGQPVATTRPSVLATALILEELQAFQARTSISGYTCGATTYNFNTVISEARAWLLQRQNTTDSGFGEIRANGSQGVSSVFLSAVVYRAFASLASPPQPATSNLLNYLVAQQNADGSWRGDAFVTTQVLASIAPATGSQAQDTDRDGVPDVVEHALGRNPLVADAAGALGAPSQAEQGVTVTSFSAQGEVGVPFSHLIETAGSPISIVSGALPPGIVLNATSGELAGTPTRGGSWSFEFQRQVAGDAQIVIGRIDVASTIMQGPADGDVPLPAWALVALAGALFGAVQRHARR